VSGQVEEYHLWDELVPPLHPLTWWAIEHRILFWPTKGMWLRRAARKVLEMAAEKGLTVVGDPLPSVVRRGGQVVIGATALAIGPTGLAQQLIETPVDVVDRQEGEQ
jgi:hypothetical protein